LTPPGFLNKWHLFQWRGIYDAAIRLTSQIISIPTRAVGLFQNF
jgi:hypothetical protein